MIINLISGPRNVSTALMYSFSQRSDMQVIDEPFYGYYLAQMGADHPGKEEVLKAQSTDAEAVMQQLLTHDFGSSHQFIKNMAHHLDTIPRKFLKKTCNIFLIRDPKGMILSFIKKISEPTLCDTAYRQQFELYTYVTETLNETPVVIDSAELLKNPPVVLQKLCEKIGISFDENMLQWEAGPIPEDGVWAKYWYSSVHKSTGFKPYHPTDEPVPERLQPLLKKCQSYYDALFQYAIKVEVDS